MKLNNFLDNIKNAGPALSREKLLFNLCEAAGASFNYISKNFERDVVRKWGVRNKIPANNFISIDGNGFIGYFIDNGYAWEDIRKNFEKDTGHDGCGFINTGALTEFDFYKSLFKQFLSYISKGEYSGKADQYLIASDYTDSERLLNFVRHLSHNDFHDFTVLPKVCLRLNDEKKYNALTVSSMMIKYRYDMSGLAGLTEPDTKIKYMNMVEVKMAVNTSDGTTPAEFTHYRGNMRSYKGLGKVEQRHGSQKYFNEIFPVNKINETNTDTNVHTYSWPLDQFPLNAKASNIEIKFTYEETGKANCSDTIILYPSQYANNIEGIIFSIEFINGKSILKNVNGYRIYEDSGKLSREQILSVAGKNYAQVTIKPRNILTEAYYFFLNWQLVD